MKRSLKIVLAIILGILVSCGKSENPAKPVTPVTPVVDPPVVQEGHSDITYQILVYSFSDSNGDGTGDFKGIESRLDYLKDLGASALWLSPIHPASSYHGYDVKDYTTVNPEYGTEADFKNLIDAAHARDIKIYIDYVLNHTSKDHPWFVDAKNNDNSQYKDWYIFSSNPSSDIQAGKISMIERTGYNSGEWTSCTSGGQGPMKVRFTLEIDANRKPKTITAQKVDNIQNNGAQNSGIWLYYGDGQMAEFYSDLSLSIEFSSDWGILVRTSKDSSWPLGTKYGAAEGSQRMTWGNKLNIYPSSSNYDPKDILLPGMNSNYYHSVFGSWMPDINYGPVSSCEQSGPFKELAAAADKWIAMGVDGFRLDAIKHIYHDAKSSENPSFLKKFYDHCNASYHSAGHTDNIYMIGEHFSEAAEVAPYYKGLPAYFEFCFWWRLKDAVNSGKASDFVGQIQGYQKLYAQYRSDYIEATKLSNHDEDRAASDLGRNTDKVKLAAAVLLSCSGHPYIYQGEELGYWGTKAAGDEYVRTPIRWTRGGDIADAKVRCDMSMLSDELSVEAELASSSSVLKVYRDFAKARRTYPALTDGTLAYCSEASGASNIAAWYRITPNQKMLVVHNFGNGTTNINFNNAPGELVCSNGTVSVNGNKISIGSYSSAIFLQK